MLTEVKNNYKSILKYFDFDESISSADYKKKKLIEMAKRGGPRPNSKTKEGRALSDYTNKSSFYYCPNFDKSIRNFIPLWFIHSDRRKPAYNKQMKQKLMQMAKSSKNKPNRRTKEGQSLSDYTLKSSRSYCSKFDKLIRKEAPAWFISKVQIKKNKLIEMAREKQPKPTQKTKYGQYLQSYTSKSSKSYCPEFDKTIRKLAPNWFVSITQIANNMKHKLIQMARGNKPRPKQRTKEGGALCRYTNKKCGAYCKEFDKTIRKLSPNWFVSSTQIANNMKHKLIQMAKNKQARPSRRTKEGKALNNYISKIHGSYCKEFEKTIRKESPNWFESKVQIKKHKLIQMAKNGESRPSQKTKEGSSLSSYTCKFSKSYCPEFDKTIRNLAPNWFIIKPRQYI